MPNSLKKSELNGFDNGWQGLGSSALEALFCAAARARAKAYQRTWLKTHRLNAQVISVGNLVAGGAGKTPLVIALAEQLHAQGRRVAVLHRGYRAQAERGIYVIEAGKGAEADPALYGDEAVLVSRRVPQAWVFSGADRLALGLRAVDDYGCDTLIMDDGFQHQRLRRNLNIVVMRAPDFLGNGHCLPRGPLREPLQALARASLIALNDSDIGENKQQENQNTRIANTQLFEFIKNNNIPLVRFSAQSTQIMQVNKTGENAYFPASHIRGQRLVLACAVARPESVLHTVNFLGAQVVGQHFKRDHAIWSVAELKMLSRRAKNLGAQLITTEKDFVKWKKPQPACLVLGQQLRWTHGENIIINLLQK